MKHERRDWWEEMKDWERSPEGRYEAQLQRLYEHRNHYMAQFEKMEEYLDKHPEARRFVKDWLQTVLVSRHDLVKIKPAQARTPADCLKARLKVIGQHRGGIGVELKHVERLLTQYPDLRSPQVEETLLLYKKPSKAVRRKPRLVVNNVVHDGAA